ncbi:MAG: Kelch repeat-containing protein [Candidatus Hodarchaeota archaeon]
MRQLLKIISFVFLFGFVFIIPINNLASSENMNPSPMKRFGHSMVYDAGNNRIILYGGETIRNNEYTQLSDTWIFDCTTNTWSQQNHTIHPIGRHNFGMVYDSNQQNVLLFGGFNNTHTLNDTWIYDCTTNSWSQKHSDISPPSRSDPAMYYVPGFEKIILFGGYSFEKAEPFSDTWVFDFSTNIWMELYPQIAPSSRYGHRMVYDSFNQTGILFGGRAGEVTNDLWRYNYELNFWKEIDLGEGEKPETRYWHDMVFDSENQNVIIFGGRKSESIFTTIFNDVWIYEPEVNEWEEVNSETAPTSRCSSCSAYDSFKKNLVLFGGVSQIPMTESTILNDTWIFNCENYSWKKIPLSNPSSSMISSSIPSNGSGSSFSTRNASSSGFSILIIVFLLPLSLVKLRKRPRK